MSSAQLEAARRNRKRSRHDPFFTQRLAGEKSVTANVCVSLFSFLPYFLLSLLLDPAHSKRLVSFTYFLFMFYSICSMCALYRKIDQTSVLERFWRSPARPLQRHSCLSPHQRKRGGKEMKKEKSQSQARCAMLQFHAFFHGKGQPSSVGAGCVCRAGTAK